MQIHLGANVFEICAPKDVEVSSPEMYGSIPKIFARKIWRLKTQLGGNQPPW